MKSLCDFKNSKDRKCVYTSSKLPILVPYPKLKNEKILHYRIIQISHFLFILIFALILFFKFFNPPKSKQRHQLLFVDILCFDFFRKFLPFQNTFDIKKLNFVNHYIPHRYFQITLWLKCATFCW